MKGLNDQKCPHCNSTNTHTTAIENTCIWDDEFYETVKKDHDSKPLTDAETLTYKCICDDCKKSFKMKIKIKAEIESVEISK